jgi:hypothetical protein
VNEPVAQWRQVDDLFSLAGDDRLQLMSGVALGEDFPPGEEDCVAAFRALRASERSQIPTGTADKARLAAFD